MYIDYVRIYQQEGKESVTCDPRKSPNYILYGLVQLCMSLYGLV